jgi:hypothetical protein
MECRLGFGHSKQALGVMLLCWMQSKRSAAGGNFVRACAAADDAVLSLPPLPVGVAAIMG